MDAQSTLAGAQTGAYRASFSRRSLVIILLALAAVGTIALLKSQKSPVESRPKTPLAPKIDYAPLVKKQIEEAGRQDELALKRFESSLGRVLNTYEPKFSIVADAASTKAAEPKAIGAIVYYLAKDKISSGHDTDVYLKNQIGPLLTPVVSEFGHDVNTVMGTLENDLRRISIQMAIDLAAIGPGAPALSQRVVPRAQTWVEFDQALKGLGYSATGVGVSLVFDASAVANSQVALVITKHIAVITSRIFAKQVPRLVASPALAAIDGPLPIGDILAAAGIAWTAYDISQMQPQFREDVRKSTKNKLDEIRDAMNIRAKAFAASKSEEFKKIQSSMGAKSMDDFSEQSAR